MAYRIIVQDGKVVYTASDSSDDVDFSVLGYVTVTKQVSVGDDPLAPGVIQTPPDSGADLIFRTNTDGITNGVIRFEPTPTGGILINNVAWPDGTVSPTAGMFLGSSSVNTLQFYSFILSPIAVSDVLTAAELNTDYPDAQPGQIVLAPSVIYYSQGAGNWRIISAPLVA